MSIIGVGFGVFLNYKDYFQMDSLLNRVDTLDTTKTIEDDNCTRDSENQNPPQKRFKRQPTSFEDYSTISQNGDLSENPDINEMGDIVHNKSDELTVTADKSCLV